MISTIAVSKGYLCRRPQPRFSTGWGSCGKNSINSYTVLLVLDFESFGLISKLNLNNFNCRYSLTTVD